MDTYVWLHTNSKVAGVEHFALVLHPSDTLRFLERLKKLDEWNRQSSGGWVYYFGDERDIPEGYTIVRDEDG